MTPQPCGKRGCPPTAGNKVSLDRQRCQVHFQRNLAARVARKHQAALMADVRAAFQAPTTDMARVTRPMATDGLQNKEIAHRLSLPVQVVPRWRKRFYHEHLPGLDERPRTGRPATQQPNSG